jgi:hypothetical protein
MFAQGLDCVMVFAICALAPLQQQQRQQRQHGNNRRTLVAASPPHQHGQTVEQVASQGQNQRM